MISRYDVFCFLLAVSGIVYFAFNIIGRQRLHQDILWLISLATVLTVVYINIDCENE